MYGLVNRAIRDLVCQQFGEDSWDRIRDRAGVDVTTFVAMDAYDDAITYSLVAAASEELGLTPESVLEAFGTFWTQYTIDEGYGDLLGMMGNSLDQFLDNLDAMHARIGGTMPELVPPSFDREVQPDGSSILNYRSTRQGLAPMVTGLLKGLAQRFDVDLEIQHLESDDPSLQRFHIRQTTAHVPTRSDS